jgi:hypothetical protein
LIDRSIKELLPRSCRRLAGLELELAPADLVAITSAVVGQIVRR